MMAAAALMLAGCDRDAGRGDAASGVQAPGVDPAPPHTPPSADSSTMDTVPAARAAGDPAPPPTSPAAQYAQAGLPQSLIDAGCYACHDVNGARIGPPLRAIAGLYRADPQAVEKLTQKIIHGGGGVWGPTPMIAHPQLDEAEARAMVEAILALN